MARRSKNLVRRPHVGKAHFGALRDLPFGVSGLYSLGNLVGCLAFQPKFCPEFVIRQYSSYGLWVETNGSSKLRVINDGTHLSRSARGRDSKPAHDHTQKSVIPLVRGLVTDVVKTLMVARSEIACGAALLANAISASRAIMYSLSGGYFASCAFMPVAPRPTSSKNNTY